MEKVEENQKSELTPSNQVAKVPISIALLEQMLPTGTKILGADFNKSFGIVDVIVTHPSFAPLKEGDLIPTHMLMAYKQFCKEGNHAYCSRVEYAS